MKMSRAKRSRLAFDRARVVSITVLLTVLTFLSTLASMGVLVSIHSNPGEFLTEHTGKSSPSGDRPAIYPPVPTSLRGAPRENSELDLSLVQLTETISPRTDVGPKLDFLVAGMPKCGTTSLLFSFLRHDETVTIPQEYCAINKRGSTKAILDDLSKRLEQISSFGEMKLGIKCPVAISDPRGIQRLATKFSDTKLIVGLRHPVKFFQSYYNYRVTEMHDNGRLYQEVVPSPESLIGANHWKDVSTDRARFELSLMQLAKTELTPEERAEAEDKGLTFAPSPFKVFLYSVEQLEDGDPERSESFRSELQSFLGLTSPIEPFPHGNVNNFVGARRHPETIDICDSRYHSLRSLLIGQGGKTAQWILDSFVQSEDVVVGGKGYFAELLSSWSQDPCEA